MTLCYRNIQLSSVQTTDTHTALQSRNVNRNTTQITAEYFTRRKIIRNLFYNFLIILINLNLTYLTLVHVERKSVLSCTGVR